MGKVNAKDATGRTVTLTRVRASFCDSLQEAQLPKKNKDPNSKPTHGGNFILEKGAEGSIERKHYDENIAAIKHALKSASVEFKKPETYWERLMEDDPKQISFRHGHRFKTDAGEIYKGYEGNMIVVAKGPAGGKRRPQIRDRYRKVIEDVSKINEIVYNGSYCDVIISWYGTDNGGTSRLTCSVEAVRSWQEGERIGGGGVYVDEDDFDAMEDDDSFDTGPVSSAPAQTASTGGGLLDF